MTDTQRNLGIGLGIVLLAGLGLYWYAQSGSTQETPGSVASTTVGGISASGDYTVGESNVEIPAPDYRAALKFDAATSVEVRAALNSQIEVVRKALNANKADFDSWVRLGAIRKVAGDYAGAAEAWEFVSVISPENAISPNNLCDLYLNFLKQYPKAEVACKKAVATNSKNIDAYVNLYYLYHAYYKQGTGADTAALNEGLKNNPGNSTLLALKAQAQAQ
mgnify:CR=1 FL=1